LAQAQAKLDALIGLDGPKKQIEMWRTELVIDQVLSAQGQEVAESNGNHMVLEGPPGTAKTTFAEIVADVLYGLGKIEHPGSEMVVVTEEDLVVGFVSQTATRMREVCDSALGRVLFIDEAYRLVPQTEGHSFGKEAINVLLKYTEDPRATVIVAGYPGEMRRFMRANQGLAGRFDFTLTFPSYQPEDIVAIARYHAANTVKIAVAEAAWPVLLAEAGRLRAASSQVGSGTLLDDAGNGRYAFKVAAACKHERARRMTALSPADIAALAQTDPTAMLVNEDDMRRAMAEVLSLAIGGSAAS